eukprot:m.210828 g.210828  ORF g.210828 m.210828 type:complete len:58 (+) comp15827_c0_seq1:175-348(+)
MGHRLFNAISVLQVETLLERRNKENKGTTSSCLGGNNFTSPWLLALCNGEIRGSILR